MLCNEPTARAAAICCRYRTKYTASFPPVVGWAFLRVLRYSHAFLLNLQDILDEADKMRAKLKNGPAAGEEPLPFSEIIHANIGDPQALGQKAPPCEFFPLPPPVPPSLSPDVGPETPSPVSTTRSVVAWHSGANPGMGGLSLSLSLPPLLFPSFFVGY